jgi:hypothetical protein
MDIRTFLAGRASPAVRHIFMGTDLSIKERSNDWIRLNSVRELVQGELKEQKLFVTTKAKCKTHEGRYICPKCSKIVGYLTIAHTGKKHADIIKDLMAANPTATIEELFRLDMQLHAESDMEYHVCCATCNGDLEN